MKVTVRMVNGERVIVHEAAATSTTPTGDLLVLGPADGSAYEHPQRVAFGAAAGTWATFKTEPDDEAKP